MGRKFTPVEGLDATADKNRRGRFHILVFRFGRRVCRRRECLWETGSVTTKVMAAVGFTQANTGRILEQLQALLRHPSLSTHPQHTAAVWAVSEIRPPGLHPAWMAD